MNSAPASGARPAEQRGRPRSKLTARAGETRRRVRPSTCWRCLARRLKRCLSLSWIGPDTKMIRLDLSYFYRLRTDFEKINLPSGEFTYGEVWFDLYLVKQSIRTVFGSVLAPQLRVSAGPAGALDQAIDECLSQSSEDQFDQWRRAHLISLFENFQSVLLSEIAVADAYIITDKAPYSTLHLIQNGESLFPYDIRTKVPEAIPDLQAAGKCLAFELGTACGFHIMRAMEAVLREYWNAVTSGEAQDNPNLGVYITKLEARPDCNKKVLAALRQIKDLHRNPISHPDASLSVAEAFSLVGLARSAVEAMLGAIPDRAFELTPPEPPEGYVEGSGEPQLLSDG